MFGGGEVEDSGIQEVDQGAGDGRLAGAGRRLDDDGSGGGGSEAVQGLELAGPEG